MNLSPKRSNFRVFEESFFYWENSTYRRPKTLESYLYLRIMTDVHSKKIRSYNMSRIKSKNTKPELLVRRFLHLNGFRYRIHVKGLPGKPDIVLPKYKTVIFIHGCFWHGHEGCKYFVVPKTRTEWWQNKINGNIVNDQSANKLLVLNGWHVIEVWECRLKKQVIDGTLQSLIKKIKDAN